MKIRRVFQCWGAAVFSLIFAECLLQSAFATDFPADPLLKSAPEFSKWTVTFSVVPDPKNPGDAQAGQRLRAITVTKTRDVVREEFVDMAGGRTEVWHVGAVQYRKAPGQAVWVESGPAGIGNHVGDPNHNPLPANGFRGWDWMGKETFAGIVAMEKNPCLVFVPQEGAPLRFAEEDEEKLAALPRIALVDEKTRLPWAFRTGALLQRFQFQDAPTVMQTLPSDLMDQIRKGEEGRQRLFQPATRPY